MPQAESHVGVFGGVLRRLVERHLVEGELVLARARHILECDRLVAEVEFGEFVHAVIVLAGFKDERDQHGVVDWRDGDAAALEDREIVFDVLADLEDGGVFQDRLQRGDGVVQFDLVGAFA